MNREPAYGNAVSKYIMRKAKGGQDAIPGSAGIRMHLAQGAVRADFLLRGRPKKIFEVSPAGGAVFPTGAVRKS